GSNYEKHVYRSDLQFPRAASVTALRFELLNPDVIWTIEGVTTGPDAWSHSTRVVYQAPGVRVFERQDVLPRAYLVHAVETVRDAAAALARLSDASFNPRERVVLEDVGASVDAAAPTQSTAEKTVADAAYSNSDTGLARLDAYEPDRLVV